MSVNQLQNTETKPWLNVRCSSIRCDGVFSYKNSTQVNGDVLQLDANGDAIWDVPPTTNYSGGMGVRIVGQMSTPLSQMGLQYLYPFGPTDYVLNGNQIQIVTTANYLLTVNISFEAITRYCFFQVNLNGAQIPGSQVKSFPNGLLLLSSINQVTPMTLSISVALNAGDVLDVYANTNDSAPVPILSGYSFISLFRLD